MDNLSLHTPAALRVLGDRTLVAHIARFQRGIPMVFQRLRRAYETALGISAIRMPETLWCAVMGNAELRLVQLLYRISRLPENVAVAPWRMDDVAARAAVSGRLDVLQWLDVVEKETPWSGGVLAAAMRRSHHDVARWLMRHRPEACRENTHICLVHAASAGDVDLLKELIAFAPHALTADVMDAAAGCRQLETVRYLHENAAAPCSSKAMDNAAELGHLDVVQYLHVNRSEGCTTRAMDSAAASGHMEVLTFLHDHRTEGCTENAMDNAHSLAILRFLHEHRTEGCTAEAMDNCAYWGHLDSLRFLHGHRTEGCTPMAIEGAAERGHLEVVRFLHAHYPAVSDASKDALTKAAENGHVAIVQFLHEHTTLQMAQCAITNVLRNGHFEAVRYLHEGMGVPIGKAPEVMAALDSGNERLIEYVTQCASTELE